MNGRDQLHGKHVSLASELDLIYPLLELLRYVIQVSRNSIPRFISSFSYDCLNAQTSAKRTQGVWGRAPKSQAKYKIK
jgi:hypothetical protein